jgi:hypothetical protein
MRRGKQRMGTGTHSCEFSAQHTDVCTLRGVCARLFKGLLGSGCAGTSSRGSVCFDWLYHPLFGCGWTPPRGHSWTAWWMDYL